MEPGSVASASVERPRKRARVEVESPPSETAAAQPGGVGLSEGAERQEETSRPKKERAPQRCRKCGQPRKGHICTAVPRREQAGGRSRSRSRASGILIVSVGDVLKDNSLKFPGPFI